MSVTIKALIASFFAVWFAGTVVAQSEYRARAGDVIVVEVLEDQALNRSLVVLSDGRINFPFAGTIRVAGRTVGQIESAITSGIRANFANEPNVFVSVQPKERTPVPVTPEEPPMINIYFLGEVNTPGLKEVEPGTTFLQALAQSGGMTNFAAEKRVQLRRTDPITKAEAVYVLNYKSILDGTAIQNNVALRDGDVIVVPERRLFE
jgi:polysaccharide export outer membrane protein